MSLGKIALQQKYCTVCSFKSKPHITGFVLGMLIYGWVMKFWLKQVC